MKENRAVIKHMIKLCWLLLFVCFGIKFLGVNWFEKSIENQNFIAICNFIDNAPILKYAILYILGYASIMIYCLATACRFKPTASEVIVFTLVYTANFVLTQVFNRFEMQMLIDFILIFTLLPFVFSKNYLMPFIACGLNLIFQFISIITCNLNILEIADSYFLIGLFYSLDIYIMIVLYFLYSNYYRRELMGRFFGFWASTNITQIEEYRKIKIEQINKYCDKKIAAIKAKEAKKPKA